MRALDGLGTRRVPLLIALLVSIACAATSCGGETDGDPSDASEVGTTTSCGEEEVGDPGDGGAVGTTTLEIGAGFQQFEPLATAQELVLERGFQGGYHIFGAMRATCIDPNDAEVDFELIQDGEVVAAGSYIADLSADGDGWVVHSLLVMLEFGVWPEHVEDKPAILSGRLVDRSGVVLESSVEVFLTCCA